MVESPVMSASSIPILPPSQIPLPCYRLLYLCGACCFLLFVFVFLQALVLGFRYLRLVLLGVVGALRPSFPVRAWRVRLLRFHRGPFVGGCRVGAALSFGSHSARGSA